jgi:hypothetical protein
MGSLAGKSPKDTYKSLLKVADETNGVTTTPSVIEDGEGTATCLDVSANKFRVTPNSDNTEGFAVKKSAGNNIFTVDTSNDLIKVGTSQVSATTQLLTFNAYRIVPASAGTHYFVGLGSSEFQSHNVEFGQGTGTEPSTTKDAGTSTQYLVTYLFPVPYNMTIDACKAYLSTHSDTDSTINVHLMSYDMVADGTTNDGNLTNGTVLADGQATSVDRSVLKTLDMTIQSSSVTSGKVIACLVENVTDTNYINIQVQVKYHIA